MPSPIEVIASPREYRAINACDGYVHKFRFETHHETPHRVSADASTLDTLGAPSVSLGWLLGKLALSGVILSGLAVIGVRALS